MCINKLLPAGLTAFVLVLWGPPVLGQTDWGAEGVFPSYGEFNAPPLACAPSPMPYSVILSVPTPGCPPVLPFGFTCDTGGTAFDNDGNVLSGGPAFPAVLNTDGAVVEMTDAATGGFIISWTVAPTIIPGPISGLGYDSTGDIIWVTDGITCVGLGLSPTCTAPPPVIFPPFPLPLLSGAPASGLDWDPCTGSLWFCDCAGMVINCDTIGALLFAFPAAAPGLTSMLTGLTVNTASIPIAGSSHSIQVTDGFTVAEFLSVGVPALPGPYYLSANPYPVPLWGGAPVSGLGFSLRPNIYGRECFSPAGTAPSIGWTGGYPFVGNAGFAVTMTGATPGSISYLVVDVAPACPALPLAGCPDAVWVAFPWALLIPLGPVPAAGSITVPSPIPPSPVPCGPLVGAPIFCQFINVISFGPTVIETTKAMSFTIGDA